MANENKPWERNKGETGEAFEAFDIYLKLGRTRSIDCVQHKLGKSSRLLFRWSSRWKWVERVQVYDDHQRVKQRLLIERRAMKRLEREMDRDDQNYEAGLKMHTRVMEGLAFPMAEVVVEVDPSGRAVKIVRPSRWTPKDLAIMAKTARELMDAATAPLPGASFEETASGDQPRGPMFVEVEEVRRDDQPTAEPPKTEEAT